METEKNCNDCKNNQVPYVNCIKCEKYSHWNPKESLVKQYVERCLPGEAAYDIINKPKHYMLFEDKGIEVRDVIEKLVYKILNGPYENYPPEGKGTLFESDYVQLMQYLMRFMDKNGVEDLKKARFYLDKLIEAY